MYVLLSDNLQILNFVETLHNNVYKFKFLSLVRIVWLTSTNHMQGKITKMWLANEEGIFS